MQFSAKQDIEVPIESVFAAVTDFDGFTTQALRRGAEVVRVDTLTGPCAGMTWQVGFEFRGKRRDMEIELLEVVRPSDLKMRSTTSGLDGHMTLELVALSKQRTRLGIELELAPKTLSARLLIQSLKLARGSLSKRLRKRLEGFARATEERFRQNTA
ncbi:SRPBCC family protein [uncultured Lentibacter sp.]|uniref:SRPBCC family protein n=1 Tax=uncultured Lentibacter sp. TaxID=1659309 RepID=UPI00260C0A99|nr:SRPBCC family protein [uncultured Lentibacter sp.]MCW1956698.1 SRPBCC family protein [Roseobacter sp.]